MLHGRLKILRHPLLPDDLLNLRLRGRIEGVGVQLRDLPLPLVALPPLAVEVGVEELGEALRVVQHGGQLGPLLRRLRPHPGVAEDLQPDDLRVVLHARATTTTTTRRAASAWTAAAAARLAPPAGGSCGTSSRLVDAGGPTHLAHV
jgi:hypothetical protein